MSKFLQILLLANLSVAQLQKNILFIAIDDLRPEIGPYADEDLGFTMPSISTPNIDSFSKESMVFKRAYAQQSLCSPSRSSMLTGRRPDTTHVVDLSTYFREVGGNFTTLPKFFKNNGYRSINIGKIFHPGVTNNDNDPPSWDTIIQPKGALESSKEFSWRAVTPEMETEFPLQDVAITVAAVEVLEELADQSLQGEKPFFIGLGYHRPHLPFVFPEEFLNLYPTEDISLPSNRYVTENLPELAWSTYQEIRQYDDTSNEGLGLQNLGDFNTTFPDAKTLELRRAYYASVSYIDREVGIVLRTLEGLGLAENTIVVLWGDHGWSLGENSEWSKMTNFEIANRIPFILRVPGVTDDGLTTDQLVESVDIFPTILEAAGFSAPPLCPEESGSIELCREGRSLLPLLQEQKNTQWKKSVFWQFPRGEIWSTSVYKCMGYTILTALEDGRRMRYTVWAGTTPDGEHSWTPDWINLCDHDELYDLTDDPQETVNRYSDPEYADLKTSLYEKLRAGWRAEM